MSSYWHWYWYLYLHLCLKSSSCCNLLLKLLMNLIKDISYFILNILIRYLIHVALYNLLLCRNLFSRFLGRCLQCAILSCRLCTVRGTSILGRSFSEGFGCSQISIIFIIQFYTN